MDIITIIIYEVLLALLVALPIAAAYWAGTHHSRGGLVVVWFYTLLTYSFIISYAWFIGKGGGFPLVGGGS